MTRDAEYDYVIVGAGSAGCVLAGRLSEDPDVRVLRIEAGGWDRRPFIRIPLGVGRIWPMRRLDRGYQTEPEPRVGNARIETARGKVVGRSRSINVMGYVRGNALDYDGRAATGLRRWSYADVLPCFKRSERWQRGETPYRPVPGPRAGPRLRRQDRHRDRRQYPSGRRTLGAALAALPDREAKITVEVSDGAGI